MISSFKCKDTQELYETGDNWRFAPIARVALRKLDMLAAATMVETLRVPPGNRLEQLRGNRKGQWSIRVNDQWLAHLLPLERNERLRCRNRGLSLRRKLCAQKI